MTPIPSPKLQALSCFTPSTCRILGNSQTWWQLYPNMRKVPARSAGKGMCSFQRTRGRATATHSTLGSSRPSRRRGYTSRLRLHSPVTAIPPMRTPCSPNSLQSTASSIGGLGAYDLRWGVCKAESITNRPADTNTNLTTDTDLAYQKAIKSSRKGPYIMCMCLP